MALYEHPLAQFWRHTLLKRAQPKFWQQPGRWSGDAKVISVGRAAIGDTGNPVVQTAILPLFKLDAEERELLSPLPAIEPHKRKKAARGQARPRSKSTTRAQTKQSATINRVEVIRQTKVLIIALEEALDYDQVRDHNQRPPILWSGDPSYQKDVKALVVELTTPELSARGQAPAQEGSGTGRRWPRPTFR
jgi:hypothetical protein